MSDAIIGYGTNGGVAIYHFVGRYGSGVAKIGGTNVGAEYLSKLRERCDKFNGLFFGLTLDAVKVGCIGAIDAET